MDDFTISIYCFIDDYLKSTDTSWQNPKKKTADAEVLTTALLAARYFAGNMVSARSYMSNHHGCIFPNKSNFHRQLQRLVSKLNTLFFLLSNTLKDANSSQEYIIDSFPVSVCKNIRIQRCKLLQHTDYRGYNHSKREYFYGFKITLVTTASGLPIQYYIAAGAIHDQTAFRAMNLDLPNGSLLYADSAYTEYQIEDWLLQLEGIKLLAERKSNAKRKDSPALAFLKKVRRKSIETTFSGINNLFPKKIHAVSIEGFLLKVFLFIFAFTLDKLFN